MDSRNRTETKTLKVGDVAPDFTLRTANREEWRLSNFRGKKNVVLAFVPFAFSSVCSAQLPSYEAELSRFNDLDTEIVSISMDSTHALSAWSKSMKTSFPLLSDFFRYIESNFLLRMECSYLHNTGWMLVFYCVIVAVARGTLVLLRVWGLGLFFEIFNPSLKLRVFGFGILHICFGCHVFTDVILSSF